MRITFKGDVYVADGKITIGEADTLTVMGWTPVNGAWVAKNPKKAVGLEGYMDANAFQQFQAWEAQRRFMYTASRAIDCTAKLPHPKGFDYLPFQKACIVYAQQLSALLLADEQRVGKTIEAIGIANQLFAQKRKANPEAQFSILVICKKTLRLNWQKELKRWLIRSQDINIILRDTGVTQAPIQIVNYESLFQYDPELKSIEWDMLIVDEAHYLKNKYSERAQLVFGCPETNTLPMRAKYKIFLTGTPMKNGRPKELWPLVHYLDPVNWDNEHEFKMNYCDPKISRKTKRVSFREASNLDMLQEELRSTIMIRRLRREVVPQMPRKRRRVVELPADGCEAVIKAELDAYNQKKVDLNKLRQAVIKARKSPDKQVYLDAITALKAGRSVAFNQMSRERVNTALAKLPMVISHLEDAIEDGSKVVVFGHHVKVLSAIQQHFGDKSVLFIGTTSVTSRDAAVTRFKDAPDCQLFLGNEAAQEGLDLSAADHVIFAELEWVPGDLSQREDRCESVINPRPLLVEHLVLEGSLDATMAKRLIKKQSRMDQALDKQVKGAA